MSKPSPQQSQTPNSKEATIQNSKEIPIPISKVAQIQNSKEAQNQNSKKIIEDVNKGNEKGYLEYPNDEKDENKNELAEALSEQDRKEQKKGTDKIANQMTESDKQEKNKETTKNNLDINILGGKKILHSESKTYKNNEKEKTIKIEKKENSINCEENGPKALLENKYSNHVSIENYKLSSDFLDKKRNREIKIDEQSINLNKTKNLGVGKSFGHFDTGDDSGYKYKMIKNSQELKNSSKNDDTLPDLQKQSENIYLSSIHNKSKKSPNPNYSSDEEIYADMIRNISTNHQRNNSIYIQNLIMHNYNSL